jgi:sulfate adenylyltransferase subunit 1
LEFVQKVEKELAILGRHTYLYAPKNGEDIKNVVKHLNNAGILVLLYAEGVDTSVFVENRSYISNWQEEKLSVSEAAQVIYQYSGIHGDDSEGGAFI